MYDKDLNWIENPSFWQRHQWLSSILLYIGFIVGAILLVSFMSPLLFFIIMIVVFVLVERSTEQRIKIAVDRALAANNAHWDKQFKKLMQVHQEELNKERQKYIANCMYNEDEDHNLEDYIINDFEK